MHDRLQMHKQYTSVFVFPFQQWRLGHFKEDKNLQLFSEMMERKKENNFPSIPPNSFSRPWTPKTDLSSPTGFFFVLYTLDFRKCTKQDNTAQYISYVSCLFFFKRQSTWKSSDISTQSCSVFSLFLLFSACVVSRPPVASQNLICLAISKPHPGTVAVISIWSMSYFKLQ